MSAPSNRSSIAVTGSSSAPKALVLPEFNPSLLRRFPDAGERARVVDQWMLQRIKQAQRTSQGLEKRLDVLNQAGAGVQKMIQILRDRLAEVQPAVSRLDDAEERARATTDQAIASIEPVRESMQGVDRQVRAKIEQIVSQDIPAAVQPMLASFKDEVQGSLQSASQLLQEQLSVAQTTAARAGEQLQQEFTTEMQRLREKVKRDLLPIESDAHKRLNEQIQMHHQQVQSLIHSAAASTWEEARGVTDKIMGQAGAFASGLEARMNAMESRASSVADRLEQVLQRAEKQAETVASALDDAAAEALRSVERRIEEALEPVRTTIESKLQTFRQTLDTEVASADAYLAERTGEAEQALVRLARQFEGRVSDSLQQFNASAEQVLKSAQSNLTDLTDQTVRAGEAAVAPAVARLEESRGTLEAKLDKASSDLAAVAKKRAEELKLVGSEVVEDVDRSLHERLDALRPRAARLFEKSIAAFRARTSDALDETMKCLETGEAGLADRLHATRAAQLDVLQDVERSLRESVSQLERQAGEMTRLLEQRLTDRVQEVVRSNRHALQDAVAQSNDVPSSEPTTQDPSPSQDTP